MRVVTQANGILGMHLRSNGYQINPEEKMVVCQSQTLGLTHIESFQKHAILREAAQSAVLCKTVDERALENSFTLSPY